jgi:Fe-S-cluster containining protein
MEAFKCLTCGECCYGEGGIFLEEGEVERISDFLKLTAEVFISTACEGRHGKLYLRTGTDGFCIYFDSKESCLIHPVKPLRCSLWPFFPAIVNDKDNWELAKEACPGINPDGSFEEFVSQAKK